MMRSLRGLRQLDWLAARSSVIGEDGVAASFAGQNLTRLASIHRWADGVALIVVSG
jgi:hypothetical protein